MKIIFRRIVIVVIVLAIGTIISVLLLFSGDKSMGPLQDLFRVAGKDVSRFEKRMEGGDPREERYTSLKWFDHYRNNKSLLDYPDTIFLGAYDNNTAESYEKIIELEDSLKTRLPIIQVYSAWGSKTNEVFPLLRAQAIYDLGSIPMITWEPWLNDFDPTQYKRNEPHGDVNKNGMKAVADGIYDTYITKWADDARDFRQPVFVRLGHEMNDPYRYPWGPQNNKPEDYIAAWRHVVELFRKAGANNVLWIWSPHPAYTNYEEYYPGKDFVDWIGIGTLNYGTVAPWSQWWKFDDIFGHCYAKLSLYSKPIIIPEFGSLGVGGDRAFWYKQALDSLPVKYPLVKAVLFFNNSSDNTTTYKVLDWSITYDSSVTATITKSFNDWGALKQKK